MNQVGYHHRLQPVGHPQEHQLQSATQNTAVNMSASAQLPAPYPPSQMQMNQVGYHHRLQPVGHPQEHQLQSATQNTAVNMSASAQLPAPYPPSQPQAVHVQPSNQVGDTYQPQPVSDLQLQQLQQNAILPSAMTMQQNAADAQPSTYHPPGQPMTFNLPAYQSQQVGHLHQHQLQSGKPRTPVDVSANPSLYTPSQIQTRQINQVGDHHPVSHRQQQQLQTITQNTTVNVPANAHRPQLFNPSNQMQRGQMQPSKEVGDHYQPQPVGHFQKQQLQQHTDVNVPADAQLPILYPPNQIQTVQMQPSNQGGDHYPPQAVSHNQQQQLQPIVQHTAVNLPQLPQVPTLYPPNQAPAVHVQPSNLVGDTYQPQPVGHQLQQHAAMNVYANALQLSTFYHPNQIQPVHNMQASSNLVGYKPLINNQSQQLVPWMFFPSQLPGSLLPQQHNTVPIVVGLPTPVTSDAVHTLSHNQSQSSSSSSEQCQHPPLSTCNTLASNAVSDNAQMFTHQQPLPLSGTATGPYSLPAKRLRESPSPTLPSKSLETLKIEPNPKEIRLTCIDPFINYVKQQYRAKAVERDTKWTLSLSVKYINLAWIDRRRVMSKEYKDVTKAMVQDGNVDTIQKKKGPIEFSEIAKDINLPSNVQESDSVGDRRLILVEGAPGAGKSTFAWEFCRKWLVEEAAKQYDLVILLRLRDKGIRNASNLEQLICHCHPTSWVSTALYDELLNSQTFHVFIILEGYDELPDSQRNDPSSTVNELISGKLLPLATILVTSRPWATKDIRKHHERHIYQHIEVLGFTKRQITDYIKNTVPEDQVSDLHSYLERHPQIQSGMYIPLNSAIVVAVYNASKTTDYQPMPNTLTELYIAVINIIIKRHLEGNPDLVGNTVKQLSLLNSTVPCVVKDQFYSLGKLAYDGIVNEKNEVNLIFSESDTPPNFDNLGFMDSTIDLYVNMDTVTSHNFLHLTFQEFFAAVHISALPPEEQLTFFKRGSGGKNGRLKVVLKFLAGFRKMDCVSKETVTDFVEIKKISEDTKYILLPDIIVNIDIINWMFEAQSDNVLSLILGDSNVGFDFEKDNMLPMDLYSLGYCITHSNCQWLLSLTRNKVLTKKNITMLAKGAAAAVGNGRIVGLKYVSRCKDSKSEFLFAKWENVLSLHQLNLKLQMENDVAWPKLTDLKVLDIDYYSHMGNLDIPSSLDSLTIDCIRLESDPVAKYLSSPICLKELKLQFCSDKHKTEPIAKALATNNYLHLQRLELSYERSQCNNSAYRYLMTFILNSTSLQDLSVMPSRVTDTKLQDLIRAVKNKPSTEKEICEDLGARSYFGLIYMIDKLKRQSDFNETFEFSTHFPQFLLKDKTSIETKTVLFQPHNSGAETVPVGQVTNDPSSIPKISLSYDFYADLAQVLQYNTTLKTLHLSGRMLCVDGAKALAQALIANSTLQHLTLHRTLIGVEGVSAIACALRNNTALLELTISHTNIGDDDGAKSLANALSHNLTLKKLTLSSTMVGNKGVIALAQALCDNSALQQLILLSLCPDITSGYIELAKALCQNSSLQELDLHSNELLFKDIREFVKALAKNSSIIIKPGCAGLILPLKCKQYAIMCPAEYPNVKHKVSFS